MWRNSLRIFVLLWIARLLIESRTTRAFRSGTRRRRNSTFSMMFSNIVGLSTLIAPTAGHAPALQQGHEQHAGRRQVEDVLRAAVRRAAHLHDLQGAEEVAAAFQVARHDHAVREGLFDPPLGIPFFGRTNLGD